jgi:hypothetical protein
MIKIAIILVAATLSSCAGSKSTDWVSGCVFGIQDAANNFGFGVDPKLVLDYCVKSESTR